MLCLAYFSSARRAPGPAELEALLAQSRRNNVRHGVTGMLCHYDGSYLQFLEGEAEPVEALYARIGRDERHHRLVEVLRQEIAERLFPDWSMALVKADGFGPEHRAFCRSLRTLELGANAEHRRLIAPVLESFRAWIR